MLGDDQLSRDSDHFLRRHLVTDSLHRVCEELFASRRAIPPFQEPRTRLLGRLKGRGPEQDLGRLPVEQCRRVMFAYVAYLGSLGLCVLA